MNKWYRMEVNLQSTHVKYTCIFQNYLTRFRTLDSVEIGVTVNNTVKRFE